MAIGAVVVVDDEDEACRIFRRFSSLSDDSCFSTGRFAFERRAFFGAGNDSLSVDFVDGRGRVRLPGVLKIIEFIKIFL